MPVDLQTREKLIREFRETGSVRTAALHAEVAPEVATEVLRAEGFDLETTDWFFEAAASFYRRIWHRLLPLRRRIAAFGSDYVARIPGARRIGGGLRRGFSRFDAWLIVWSARNPVKKSVAAMVLASLFLTAYWLVDPELQPTIAFLFLASFGLGAGLLLVHTRSPRLLGSAGVVFIAAAAYALTEALAARPGASFRAVVLAEGLRALLVPLLAWSFLDALHQSTGFLEKLRIHVPIGSTALTLGLFLGGTAAAFLELYLVVGFSRDPASVRFVARYGVSYLLWSLGGASLLFTHVYLLYLAALTSLGRVTTRRILVAMITGIMLVAFVGGNLVTVLSTQAGSPPGPMRVGIHATDVEAALAGPWDPFVHLEVGWHVVETSPGVLDWSRYDAQLDAADAAGIDVYLLIGTTPPDWFAQDHEDAAMRDASGRVFVWVDEDPRVEERRIWEFSFASEAVVAAKEAFTRTAAARYASRPSVVALAIQNEPAWPADFDVLRTASYDAYTEGAFLAWLRARYGTLDALNTARGADYTSWSEVSAPHGVESPLWPEWLTFREDLLMSFVDRLASAVRSETWKPVTVKIMAHYLSRYVVAQTGLTERVLRSFVNASDLVSVDLYPLSRADLRRSLVFFQSLAAGKRLWVSEFNLFLSSALPGTGSAMFASLVEMSRFAERAIVFTWEGHYLYGVRLYPYVPGLVGIRMFRDARDGQATLAGTGLLVAADAGAIPNLYGAYVLASGFANVPVIPWPVLLLLLVPIPLADLSAKRKWKRRLRLAALAGFAVTTVLSNLGPWAAP